MSRTPAALEPSERIRAELVQIAAVAVAAIEDLDTGVGADRTVLATVIADIGAERLAQNQKWGPQHHEPIVWLAILAEEVGEFAREIEHDGSVSGSPALVALLDAAEGVARRILELRSGS